MEDFFKIVYEVCYRDFAVRKESFQVFDDTCFTTILGFHYDVHLLPSLPLPTTENVRTGGVG